MREGTIADLMDYYFENEEFAGELERATEEFFGYKKNLADIEINENIEGLFNEWLVYDFILENGKNLLEYFYDCNPLNFPENKLKIYKDLQNNEYAMFEVLKVKKGKGLEIMSLQSGREYFANEFMGTFQILKGNIFPGRVGKVDDHWELVGTNSLLFDIKISEEMRNNLLNAKDKVTPKIIYDIFLSGKKLDKDGDNASVDFDEELSLEEIEAGLDEKLEEFGIKRYVSVDLIKKWISDLDWKENENIISTILSILLGLISAEHDIEEAEGLVYLVISLYNATPQKYLGNISPNEAKENKKGKRNGARMEEADIGGGEWMEYMNKALEYLNNNKNEQAAEYHDKCFEALLEEKTTNPEIYRIYGNLAMNYFVLGEEQKGAESLQIALKLNHNYDFARTAFNNYENGEYENLIISGRLKGMKKNIKKYGKAFLKKLREEKRTKDPAIEYYDFIKKFNINFATKESTVSDITIIGPNGVEEVIKGKRTKIGRNDPCPCGAKKPDGAPKKYKHCCGK